MTEQQAIERAKLIAKQIEDLCSKHQFDIVQDGLTGVSVRVSCTDGDEFHSVTEQLNIVPF